MAFVYCDNVFVYSHLSRRCVYRRVHQSPPPWDWAHVTKTVGRKTWGRYSFCKSDRINSIWDSKMLIVFKKKIYNAKLIWTVELDWKGRGFRGLDPAGPAPFPSLSLSLFLCGIFPNSSSLIEQKSGRWVAKWCLPDLGGTVNNVLPPPSGNLPLLTMGMLPNPHLLPPNKRKFLQLLIVWENGSSKTK